MLLSPASTKNDIPIFRFPRTGQADGEWKKFKSFENEKPHATYSKFVT
jgi:hypothetical protein